MLGVVILTAGLLGETLAWLMMMVTVMSAVG
jgi:hypothetical protein